MNPQSATARADPTQPVHVGDHLRQWRQRRHLSQLDLAGDAEISARHLSFVETGRAAPSRDMVLKLAERLNVPLRERNVCWWRRGSRRRFRNDRSTTPR